MYSNDIPGPMPKLPGSECDKYAHILEKVV